MLKAQVSFQIEAQEVPKVAESDTFEFRTALGKTYHLYAHSYLGFGQDYAQDKLIDLSPLLESSLVNLLSFGHHVLFSFLSF